MIFNTAVEVSLREKAAEISTSGERWIELAGQLVEANPENAVMANVFTKFAILAEGQAIMLRALAEIQDQLNNYDTQLSGN